MNPCPHRSDKRCGICTALADLVDAFLLAGKDLDDWRIHGTAVASAWRRARKVRKESIT